jgi:D-alanyl-D-alanine carboxypeptidase/D-alanyl-D-alanine-endopeptidase (penicillin-binding protein 4)
VRRRPVFGCAVVGALALALAATASTAPARAAQTGASSLRLALRHALSSRQVDPAQTGALVVDLRTGDVVFQSHTSLSMAPASAEKLTVAFAALRLLGPSYRFRTEVLGTGELAGRDWRGDLYLAGMGDPTLRTRDLGELARKVASWGITRVEGSVVADEHYYDTRRGARGWKPSFLAFESRPLSALALEDVPLRGADSSAAAAAAAFTVALRRRGVAIADPPRTGRAPGDVLPLALEYSEPLATIVQEMNRESDNIVAEMLLKQLGAEVGARGTTAAGAAVVLGELEAAGVPMAGVRIVDGSGLSRLDRLTARALVVLLRTAERDPGIRLPFLASLAIAGVSGTLRDRLRRRPARGRVIAKTGTTNEASALAGFVRRRYVFAILQNGSPLDYWSARSAQDRFVTLLARA